MLRKNDTVESTRKERDLQGRKATGELGSVIKGRTLKHKFYRQNRAVDTDIPQ